MAGFERRDTLISLLLVFFVELMCSHIALATEDFGHASRNIPPRIMEEIGAYYPSHDPELRAIGQGLEAGYLARSGKQADALHHARMWRRHFMDAANSKYSNVQDAFILDGPNRISLKIGDAYQGVLVRLLLNQAERNQAASALLMEEAFESAQISVAPVVAGSIARMAIREAVTDPELRAILRHRERVRRSMRIFNVSSKYIDANGFKDVAKMDEQVRSQLPDYDLLGRSFTVPDPVDVAAVQRALADDEALVFPFHIQGNHAFRQTVVWVVTKTGFHSHRIGEYREVFQAMVEDLRSRLGMVGNTRGALPLAERHFVADDLLVAFRLYQKLLQPAEKLIAGKSLIIVPTEPLAAIPFHLLVTDSRTQGIDFGEMSWLVRRHAITTLPSISAFMALRQQTKAPRGERGYLGIGNPIYNRAVPNGNISCENWDGAYRLVATRSPGSLPGLGQGDVGMQLALENLIPLPETVGELCDIGGRFEEQDRTILLADNASEKQLKDWSENGRLERYGVVHIATHGLISGEISGIAEPGLALSRPVELSGSAISPISINDGFLSATEVLNLNLDADLVILSACNTASGGEGSSEAFSGLAAAFFLAGTRSMLVSHWPVFSEAAVDLMTHALAETKNGVASGTAKALRLAMLELLDSEESYKRHPAYWAPFSFIGLDRAG